MPPEQSRVIETLVERRIDRRAFLRFCGLAAPAVAASVVLGAEIDTGEAARIALAPPDPLQRMPQATSAMAYTNPIVAENCPDPSVLYDDGVFYMVSTTHVLPAFPIRVSSDLVHWRHTGLFVFTRANRPRWANDHFWAPELQRMGDRYVAYYTARSRETNRLCIGVATAVGPGGPYVDLGHPLIDEGVAVLDPGVLKDDDGRQYLYWKADGPDGPSGPIYAQELSEDGLTLVGPRREIARNDLAWEGRLIEAPAVVKRGGYYYLFYSGGAFNRETYAVGVARSTSPIEGFEKRGDPILRGSERWKSPGHNAIVPFEGEDYIVYHAWEGHRFRNVRPSLFDRIVWNDDGWPSVNDGMPSAEG